MQPGIELRLPGERPDGLKGGNERLLNRVGAILIAPQVPVCDRQHFAAELPHQCLAGRRVLIAEPCDERRLVAGLVG